MAATPSGIARVAREKDEQRRLVAEVLELRKSGHSFRRIAEIQGCAVKTAMSRYRKALARHVPTELVESVRAIELDRFDAITLMNMSLLVRAYEAGDTETYLKVQDRIYATHDRRKKLVPIEVPTQLVIDQKVTAQTDEDRELADLLSRAAQSVEDKLSWINDPNFVPET